jgi:hypothetical protein
MKFSGLLIAVAGACTALLGAYCMYAEAAPVLRGGTTAYSRLNAMPDGTASIGMSTLSQNFALRDCQIALNGRNSGIARLQGTEFQQRLPTLCAEMAENVLSRTPAQGHAHLILALAATHRGDLVAFDTHLRASQALSPGETRYARPRMVLAEANIAALSADGAARHESDLLLLLRSGRSIWTLAQRYVDDEGMRTRLAAVLQLATPEEQNRFLGAVRQLIDRRARS